MTHLESFSGLAAETERLDALHTGKHTVPDVSACSVLLCCILNVDAATLQQCTTVFVMTLLLSTNVHDTASSADK